eukprot:CAMPEP_0113673442 /NCGR_PEP_ID=MMETSP0038_2-20120614/6861_1 /TAXON_ID=2898 /ORGANISM="Cryptomonas paramecium" /LENGTH=575 /DNA_ID=CAMNT_0000589903 /DNA_START=275 /DNA_END=1998 /DNA_ORIENTATION=- /assembly_acc=CAM_ASM_000170
MSWRQVSGYTVEFEIISTWRYSFSWPYPISNQYTGPCGYPGIGDKVPLVGISPGSTDTDPQQAATGSVYVQLRSGEDGKNYDLVMKVESYSVEEDWISGISKVNVTYSKPYASNIAFFPPSLSNYVASVGSKSTTQPYNSVPWVATFSGCCRQYQSLNSQGTYSWPFSIQANVDLTDTLGSPRIVTLPQHWINAPLTESDTVPAVLTFCAITVTGPNGLNRSSHGTINYPSDDNQLSTFNWFVVSGPTGANFRADSSQANCATLEMPSIRSGFPQPDTSDPIAVAGPLHNSLTVGVSIGNDCNLGPCNMASAEVSLIRLPLTQRNKVPTLPSGSSSAFSCISNVLSAVRGLPVTAAAKVASYSAGGCLDWAYQYDPTAADSTGTRSTLEVRYIMALADRQTTQLTTAPGRLVYSKVATGYDNAGLLNGVRLSAPYGLQDIKIAFSSDVTDSRPLDEVPLAADQRDYSAKVGALDAQGTALAAAGYAAVAGSNFNQGAGGTIVTLYTLYWSLTPAQGTGATPTAVTGLQLVPEAEAVMVGGVPRHYGLEALGYSVLPENLLSQSGRGAVYLAVRRG